LSLDSENSRDDFIGKSLETKGKKFDLFEIVRSDDYSIDVMNHFFDRIDVGEPSR
jgi:hypothetical protein